MKSIIAYLKTMLLVFVRPAVLVGVYRNWRGIGVWYVLLVFAVLYIPILSYAGLQFYQLFGGSGQELSQELQVVVDQIPTIYLEKDALTVPDASQPIIVMSSSGQTVMSIDTRDAVSQIEQAPLHIARRSLVLNLYDQNSYVIKVSDLTTAFDVPADEIVKIDRALIMEWLFALKEKSHILPFAAYFGEVTGRTVDYMMWSLLMAFALLAIASLFGLRLQFVPALRMAVVAGTPVMLLKLVPLVLGSPIFVYGQTVHVVLHLLYLYLGAEALRKHQPSA